MIMAGAGDDAVLKKMLYLYLGTYAAQKVGAAAVGWCKALLRGTVGTKHHRNDSTLLG